MAESKSEAPPDSLLAGLDAVAEAGAETSGEVPLSEPSWPSSTGADDEEFAGVKTRADAEVGLMSILPSCSVVDVDMAAGSRSASASQGFSVVLAAGSLTVGTTESPFAASDTSFLVLSPSRMLVPTSAAL